jgi:hypothetical protein
MPRETCTITITFSTSGRSDRDQHRFQWRVSGVVGRKVMVVVRRLVRRLRGSK